MNTMFKLAGHLPLADMISQVIEDSRAKIAADEASNDGEKDKQAKINSPLKAGIKGFKNQVKKNEKDFDKNYDSDKDEWKDEKKASIIDSSDPEEIDKLASALDQVGDEYIKIAADGKDHGGEYKGGGETLAVLKGTSGKQPYKKDSSKAHNVPMNTGLQAGDAKSATTQVPNDHAKAPGGAPYPKKGVMKTAAESVMEKIRAAAQKPDTVSERMPADETEDPKESKDTKEETKSASVIRLQDALAKKASKEDKAVETEDNQPSAVDFILGKLANVEKRMGGMTLDSKSGDGPKPPSNPGRELIESNSAVTNAKKVQAKSPQKKLLSQVLNEPAMSKAHDSKVQENLRNASKGGVKIAAARELLKKIAEEGCTCDGKGECKHCKMKKAMEKKSMGNTPMTGSPTQSTSPMM